MQWPWLDISHRPNPLRIELFMVPFLCCLCFICQQSITMKYVASDVVLWALFSIGILCFAVVVGAAVTGCQHHFKYSISFFRAKCLYIVSHSDIEFNARCLGGGSKHLHGFCEHTKCLVFFPLFSTQKLKCLFTYLTFFHRFDDSE